MSYKYDVLVFIGRFQPFHRGHYEVIRRASTLAKDVVVFVGSANRGRNFKNNPFTFDERKEMILDSLNFDTVSRIHIEPLNDILYNDSMWIKQVQERVENKVLEVYNGEGTILHGLRDIKVGLIGCAKDGTSYYLKLFPTWGSEDVEHVDGINATDIREDFFENGLRNYHDWPMPQPALDFMERFFATEDYETLVRESKFIQNYKESVYKYPRIEHTTDAVVTQSGHVLLIRRRAEPGKGMWALPGGFLNPEETMLDGVIRELREETKIKVPAPVLRGSLKRSKAYDDPRRSTRGRIITQAFHFDLTAATELPKVKGSDDADKAAWVPLADLRADQLYEDHYFILMDLIGGWS